MKKYLKLVGGLAVVLLGGSLVTSAFADRQLGVRVSDKDAATVVGGCIGASTTTCSFGYSWFPPRICGGSVINIDQTNPTYDSSQDPTGNAYCGSGCSALYFNNVTSCGG